MINIGQDSKIDAIDSDADSQPADNPTIHLKLTFADGASGEIGFHHDTDEALLYGFDKLLGKKSESILSILKPMIPNHLHHLIVP